MSEESSESIHINRICNAIRYLRREAEAAGLEELAKILEEAESNWEKNPKNIKGSCLAH